MQPEVAWRPRALQTAAAAPLPGQQTRSAFLAQIAANARAMREYVVPENLDEPAEVRDYVIEIERRAP